MLTDFRDADGTLVPASAYYDALSHTHQRRVRVRVMDLDHGSSAWLPDLSAGQVTINVDRSSEATRVATVTLIDPTRSIGFEPNSPKALPQHLRRMIQIVDERSIDGYGWVGCPVFTGPIREFDRTGAEVHLAAKGKDILALGSFGRSHKWKKGRKVVDVIREILILAGERSSRIHLPNLPNTLRQDFNVSRVDRPLAEARKLARSVGDRVIFYDGRGHVVMRRKPTIPTLPRLDEDWLMGPVRIDRRELTFKNGWIVLGAKPGGGKPRVTSGLIGLPKNNPLSAYALRRNGNKWFWLIRQEERSNVKSNVRARQIAMRMRDEQVRHSADVSVDILPLPNIEEYDLFRAVDPLTGHVDVRVHEATIPLVGGVQTIGSVRRIPVPRRR